jgi:hypothetical protein
MQPEQTGEKKKRVYKKPRLRTIELAAEEVLAVGCKLASGGEAPLSEISCTANNCSGAGS